MTNQHPLTDEICQQIAEDKVAWHPDWPVLDPMEKTCMRASYDLGQKDGIEQVIAWLRSTPFREYIHYWDWDCDAEMDKDELITDLKKAMRPSTEENN